MWSLPVFDYVKSFSAKYPKEGKGRENIRFSKKGRKEGAKIRRSVTVFSTAREAISFAKERLETGLHKLPTATFHKTKPSLERLGFALFFLIFFLFLFQLIFDPFSPAFHALKGTGVRQAGWKGVEKMVEDVNNSL